MIRPSSTLAFAWSWFSVRFSVSARDGQSSKQPCLRVWLSETISTHDTTEARYAKIKRTSGIANNARKPPKDLTWFVVDRIGRF